jgi:hypothetical protein
MAVQRGTSAVSPLLPKYCHNDWKRNGRGPGTCARHWCSDMLPSPKDQHGLPAHRARGAATAAAWCNAIQQDREPPVTPYPYHGCHSTDDRSVCMPMCRRGATWRRGLDLGPSDGHIGRRSGWWGKPHCPRVPYAERCTVCSRSDGVLRGFRRGSRRGGHI